jgi:multidrug resistance efflux pump
MKAERRRRVLPLFITMLSALIAFEGCEKSQSGPDQPGPEATDKYQVKRQDLMVVLTEFGEVEAREIAAVTAAVSGEVIWVCVEGTPVKKGDIVLKIGTQPLLNKLEEDTRSGIGLQGALKTSIAVSKAMGRQSQGKIKIAKINLDIAKQRLAEAKSHPNDSEKKLAHLDLNAAEMKTKLALAEETATRQLAAKGYTPEARAKATQLSLLRSQTSLAQAQAAYQELSKGRTEEEIRVLKKAVRKAEINVEETRFKTESEVAIKEQSIKSSQVRYNVYCANLERQKREITAAAAKAPIDGVVALVDVYKGSSDMSPVQVGETYGRGRELMKIADISTLRIRIFVNERDIKLVKEGQKARVRLISQPDTIYNATVADIAIFAQDKNKLLGSLAMGKSGPAGVNAVEVRLDLDVPAGAPAPHLGASALIALEVLNLPGVLTVPSNLLLQKNGQSFVTVIKDGKKIITAVKTGASSENMVVITEGLMQGDILERKAPATNQGPGL